MSEKKLGLVLALDGEKEFKQQVTSINKSLTAMKSELSLVTAKYEGQANTLQALSEKDRVLNNILQEQRNKFDKTNEALKNAESKQESLKKSVGELQESFDKENSVLDDLKKSYETAKKRLQEMEQEGNSSEKTMKKQGEAVKALKEAVKKQEKAVDESNTELSTAQNEYRKCGNIVNDWKSKLNTAEAQVIKANGAVSKNAAYLKEAEEATDGCAKSIDAFGNKTKGAIEVTQNFLESVKEGFGQEVGSKVLDVLGEGIEAVKDSMMDVSKASSQLQASTGLSESVMQRYKKVMEEIKGNNFGEDYQDVADAMSEVIQVMGELNDTEMKNVTESAITLRDTFGMDINEQVRAVDVMMKTMGVDAQTAFDLIATGAQNGLNRSGELADNITEYGQLWGQAGFSAEEMFSILENGLDAGAYNLDKVNDYVKEFGVSLADGRIEKNLGYFSDGTKKLFGEWKNGKASTSDVFYSVISDLEKMENQQEALTIASETWSALGEDNAMQVLAALNDVNDGYKNVRGTMESLKEVKYSDLESAVSGLGSSLQENIVTPIADAALPAITGLFEGATKVIDGIGEAISPQKSELEQFIDDIKSSNDEVQRTLDNAQSTMDGAEADVSELEAYKQVLMDLNEQESLTEFQKYQLANAVQALGSSVPGLAEAFDAETGTLAAANQELEEMFSNAESVAMQNALIKAQAESYDALAQATINKAKADSAVEAAQNNLAESTEKYNKKISETGTELNEYYGAQLDAQIAVDEAVAAQKEANQVYEEAQKQTEQENEALKDLKERYGLLSESAEEAKTGIEGAGNAAGDTAQKFDEYGNNITGMTEEEAAAVAEASQKIVDSYESMRQGIADSITGSMSLFDEFSGGTEITAEQINANLESQRAGVEQWSENMQTLAGQIGKGMSQELYDELASMGPEQGANAVQALVDALNSESGEFEEVSKNWSELLKLQDDAGAIADATTEGKAFAQGYAAGIEEGSEEVTVAIEKLGTVATDKAKEIAEPVVESVASGIEPNSNLISDAITSALDEAAAQVSQKTDSFRQAGTDLGTAVSEGLQEALEGDNGAVILNPDSITGKKGDYENAGEVLGEAVVTGLQNTQKDINDALSPDAGGLTGSTGDYQSAGEKLGQAFAEGLSLGAGGAGTAGGLLSEAARESTLAQIEQMRNAGKQQAQRYIDALNTAQQQSGAAGCALAEAARNGAASGAGGFSSVGYNMAAGVASGINAGSSGAINAAASMARQALAAAKRELDIHSPSKKFKDDVGKQVGKGFAFGIKDSTSLAGAAASQMSSQVFTKATAWLVKYKKSHKVSLDEEKYYWQQVAKHTQEGTDAYNKAVSKMLKASVSSTAKSGKKTVKKDAETYYSEVLSAAQKYASNQQVLNDWSLERQMSYWKSVRSQLKKGTQAWYDATKEIKSLQSEIQQAAKEKLQTQANVQKSILDKYKVYNKMSAKAEMDYWDIARKQFKEGTDERIEADENYLKAQEEYYEKKAELRDKEDEEEKRVNDEKIERIKDLNKAYDDAVDSRRKEILSSMNLFESWDAGGYTKDVLTANLKTQVEGLKFWEQQLEELGKKNMSKELLDELAAMGPDAAASLWSLNQMTEEELEEYTKLWTEKNELAKQQAIKDNESLWKETQDGIEKAEKAAAEELAKLKTEYDAAVLDLNTGLSVGLQSLVAQAASIGEDIVSSLINAISKPTTAQNVTQAVNGIISDAKASAAAQAAANKAASVAQTGANAIGTVSIKTKGTGSTKDKAIMAAINSGGSHSKKLTKQEKSEHHDLWEYIVQNYGHKPNNNIYTKLAKALGVNVSEKVTSAQKNEILKKLKAAGYAKGTKRIEEDGNYWLHEGELLVRKRDNASLRTLNAGDGVIPANLTENLMKWGEKKPSEFLAEAQESMKRQQEALRSQMQSLDYSGIAKLNRLMESQQKPETTIVNVDNSNLASLLGMLINAVNGLSEKMDKQQVVMDTGALVGAIQPAMSRENAAVAIRRSRGRM